MFTRFFQGYVLPRKFGVDRRKGNFSSLIVAGDMTRTEALIALKEPTYPPEQQQRDLGFFLKKMDITPEDFDRWMRTPVRPHTDYTTYCWFFEGMPRIKALARRLAKRE